MSDDDDDDEGSNVLRLSEPPSISLAFAIRYGLGLCPPLEGLGVLGRGLGVLARGLWEEGAALGAEAAEGTLPGVVGLEENGLVNLDLLVLPLLLKVVPVPVPVRVPVVLKLVEAFSLLVKAWRSLHVRSWSSLDWDVCWEDEGWEDGIGG